MRGEGGGFSQHESWSKASGDIEFGQGDLEALDGLVGDASGVPQIKSIEVGEFLDVAQAFVSDPGAAQV